MCKHEDDLIFDNFCKIVILLLFSSFFYKFCNFPLYVNT